MTQQKFQLIRHAIAVGILGGHLRQSFRQIHLSAFRGPFLAELAETVSEGIVRELVEVLGKFFAAGQMTGGAIGEGLGEETFVIFFQGRAVGRRRVRSSAKWRRRHSFRP